MNVCALEALMRSHEDVHEPNRALNTQHACKQTQMHTQLPHILVVFVAGAGTS